MSVAEWVVVAVLGSLAFLALVIVVVVSVMKRWLRPASIAGSSAVRMLEESYARGEVSRDEFLQRRAILTGAADERPVF